jgi:hypothetical protein
MDPPRPLHQLCVFHTGHGRLVQEGRCAQEGTHHPPIEPPGLPHDHPACQADLPVPLDPPGLIHDFPADPPASHPQDEPGVVALPKARRGPPVPVDALAVRIDINPTDLDSYLVLNIENCVFGVTHIPRYTLNDAPWAMEPAAIQEGPVKGITVSRLCNPVATIRGKHAWRMPVAFLMLRGKSGTESGWVTKWYLAMVQFLQGLDGSDIFQTFPGGFPIPVQAWCTRNITFLENVPLWCIASVRYHGTVFRAVGGGGDARFARQAASTALAFHLHTLRVSLGPPGFDYKGWIYKPLCSMCETINVFGMERIHHVREPWAPDTHQDGTNSEFLRTFEWYLLQAVTKANAYAAEHKYPISFQANGDPSEQPGPLAPPPPPA